MEGDHIYVEVNPEIDSILKEEEQESIIDLEKRLDRRIIIQAKADFHIEQYEVTT